MKATIRIQEVYSNVLGKSKKELVVIKEGKVFVGALFFDQETDGVLKAVIDEMQIEGSVMDIILGCYKMKKKHNLLAKDDKTLQTMVHWQYVNGFSDECIVNGYSFKNDTEYLASLFNDLAV